MVGAVLPWGLLDGMPCGNTGCLSCQGKQSTSLSLSGRLLFLLVAGSVHAMGDSIKLGKVVQLSVVDLWNDVFLLGTVQHRCSILTNYLNFKEYCSLIFLNRL